jgi:hypothetical protein
MPPDQTISSNRITDVRILFTKAKNVQTGERKDFSGKIGSEEAHFLLSLLVM